MKVVVTGLAASYPFGGVFWDYLQYAAGFEQLGCDVLYLEDTGKWCYDPRKGTFVESGAENAAHLARQIETVMPMLRDRWHFIDGTGRSFGMERAAALRFCGQAELFLHISASCWMRDEYFAARRVAFIDSDPMYTQSGIAQYADGEADATTHDRIANLQRHHVFFTFAENIGNSDCRVPTDLIDWHPTRQPIVLDLLEPHAVPLAQRRRVLTTVASWEPHEKGPLVRGVQYCGKSTEILRLGDLPARSPVPLEMALSGPFPEDELRRRGWQLVDPKVMSRDAVSYRDYLANSLGEFSVAKNAYVASHSGWFSCRSACYLALGVPVVVQSTGFERVIPTGRGVLAFNTPAEAQTAIADLLERPQEHAEAARQIARDHFDARRVLGDLLKVALA